MKLSDKVESGTERLPYSSWMCTLAAKSIIVFVAINLMLSLVVKEYFF